MWTLLMIAVGVLIGWNFPQPEYTKQAQASLTAWAKAQWKKLVG